MAVLELPEFSGDPQDWPLFIKMFENSTKKYDVSQEHNLRRLRKYLTGKARELVHSLLVLPESVPEVIDNLQMRFGRPDRIIRQLRDEIKVAASVTDDNLETLIDFSSNTKSRCYTGKRRLGESTQ